MLVKVIVCLRSYILELGRCKNNGVKGLYNCFYIEYKEYKRVSLEGANKERSYYLGCLIQIILTLSKLNERVKKYMNVHKNQKKYHLQTLQTILHRIGPFVSILARSSARTHTPLQKEIQFEQN